MSEEKRPTIQDVRPTTGRDVLPVEWPGGKTVGLLLLRCLELQEAHFAAVDRFVRQGKPWDGMHWAEFLREKELQEVHRMLLAPDSKQPKDRIFKDADEARRELTTQEVEWFQGEHARLAEERDKRLGFLAAGESEGQE